MAHSPTREDDSEVGCQAHRPRRLVGQTLLYTISVFISIGVFLVSRSANRAST
jgi:hypothetical protein